MGKILLVVGLAVAVVAGSIFMMYLNFSSREIGLRNRASAEQDVCKMIYDETWKIISQKAQVSDQYKEAFKEIFPQLMEGRYGNERGGALMSWITEHNPEFDASLYKNLMTSIEVQRQKFTEAQKTLRDVKLQHDNIRTQPISSWFVGGRPELKITIVTSSKTENVFEQAKEDDINVFQE